ncbi:SDR family NAD(P)-dependent oxidoreductase [Croceicoccus sediminis]|uniref:SDR family NAD(P)-dependent oxidoreductase n=1 Tax=Croceicoccus sediminis TaxID=2571150 RepID=UPI00118229C1|nr:SDR family NAD(P)-dependent oxidoreductase [Croceicoccus sediminis]
MRCAIFGGSGGLGQAFASLLLARDDVDVVHVGSRNPPVSNDVRMHPFHFDFRDEASIEAASQAIGEGGPLDLVIVATGILQREPDVRPERSWRAIEPAAMEEVFAINTFGPALIGKHFLPLMRRDGPCRFAAISARVGSIGDNRLGGWHSYRASKAALNMMMRNFAIEMGRRNREAIVVSLHPGTVDTGLSQPFQSNVPEGKLFTPEYSASCLLSVLDGLGPKDNGGFFAWDGQAIEW